MSQQVGAKRRKCYEQSTLTAAVEAVTLNGMSVRCASRSFGIPRGTLFDKIHHRRPMEAQPKTVLTAEEEQRLADWVVAMAKIGYGRTRQEVLDTVKRLLDADGRPNPFKDNRPGKDWWQGFTKRHPELSERRPQQLGKERAVITQEKVNFWYDEYKRYILDDVKDPSLLLEPSRLFNADESGFSLCPKSGKVMAAKGSANVYNFTASDKTQITVLACMGATGHFMKPLIVYPGQRFTFNPLEGFQEAVMGRTDNGWMDGELFATWLEDVFVPEVNEKGIKKPVVLFVDGHSTHMSLKVSDICRQNGVELYCLLAHASHLMQPCDLRLFSPLKEAWKMAVREYQFKNIGEHVTKRTFASVFKGAWEKSTTVSVAVNGFRDAGLFPFDPSKVLRTAKMAPSSIFRSPTVEVAAPRSNEKQTSNATETSQPATETVSTSHPDQSASIDNLQTPRPNAAGAAPQPHQETCNDVLESSPTSTTSPQQSGQATPLETLLQMPSVPAKKTTVQRPALPKAITGLQFREFLEKKQKEKERVEKEKAERKKEREMKKMQKEEEKKKKQEIREAKKNERVQKNEQKKLEKMIKDIEKERSKKRSREIDSGEESDSSPVLSEESDAEANFELDVCFVCDEKRDDSPFWIRCTRCCRLLHMRCVKSIDLSIMSEEDIVALQFECDYC